MSHLRTLVVAAWVVFTIAAPAAAGPVARAGRAVEMPEPTGTVDATADLQALIDRTPEVGSCGSSGVIYDQGVAPALSRAEAAQRGGRAASS
jgi:hypothetical protein